MGIDGGKGGGAKSGEKAGWLPALCWAPGVGCLWERPWLETTGRILSAFLLMPMQWGWFVCKGGEVSHKCAGCGRPRIREQARVLGFLVKTLVLRSYYLLVLTSTRPPLTVLLPRPLDRPPPAPTRPPTIPDASSCSPKTSPNLRLEQAPPTTHPPRGS